MGTKVERRCHARQRVCRPVKLCCVDTGRYLTGRTCNISASGALLEVANDALAVTRGQRIAIGVAWNRKQMVLDSEHLVKATVVRNFDFAGCRKVAVRFVYQEQLARSA